MKNLFFIITLFIVTSVTSFANSVNIIENAPKVTKTTSKDKLSLKIDLGKVENAESVNVEEIDKLITSSLENSKFLQCEVEVSAKVSVGIAEFTVSVKVSGECSEIRTAGRAIAQQILNDIIAMLKSGGH
jgi:hypothetical protein